MTINIFIQVTQNLHFSNSLINCWQLIALIRHFKNVNMKSFIIILTIVLFNLSCHPGISPSNTAIVNTEKVNASGSTVLLGRISITALQKNPYKDWFNNGFSSYQPDKATIQTIQPLLANKKIEVFLGTWCGDSKREVPKLMRILTDAGYDTSLLSLICVDNGEKYKQSPQHEEAGKNIHHVPTIIVYDGKQEMGRIIESPVISLEKDVATILKKESYTHHYQAIEYWLKNVPGINKEMDVVALEAVAEKLKGKTKHQGEFNAYGYMLLGQEKYTQAINVFKLNNMLHPNIAGLWDSLAEGYVKAGNKKAAIAAYEKVLVLEPTNETAKKAIAQLQAL